MRSSLPRAAVHELDELSRAKQRDVLTGTPNRALIWTVWSMPSLRAMDPMCGTLYDLDNVKQVNDSLGHESGDDVLRAAARRLESAVRGSDTVSRHGGDEFLVLLAEISHTSDAVMIADKILSVFLTPIRAGNDLVFISASIGIAIFTDDGVDTSGLIHGADTAMYHSKRRGPGRYAIHGDAVGKQHAADRSDIPPRALQCSTAYRLAGRNRSERKTEHERIVQEPREANTNLSASTLRGAQEREAPAETTSPQLA